MGIAAQSGGHRIVVRDKDHVAGIERATRLAEALRVSDARHQLNVRIRGPMPCPIARVADFHRQQIELLAADARSLQRLLTDLRNHETIRLTSDARTAIDVDPVALL